jgi:hypothetical protein
MPHHTADRNDENGRKESVEAAGKRFLFREHRWMLLVGPIVGGLAGLLVIVIASNRPHTGIIQPKKFVRDETHRDLKVGDFDGASRAVYAEPKNANLENEKEKERIAKKKRIASELEREEKMYRAFKLDYPLVDALNDYRKHALNASLKKYRELEKRNKSLFESKKAEVVKVDELNEELTQVLTIFDMAKSQEQVGPGTLGEAARTVLDHPESEFFGKLKKNLSGVVMTYLDEPEIAAQIISARDQATLVDVASRVAPLLRAVSHDRMAELTTDPLLPEYSDERVRINGLLEIRKDYERIMYSEFTLKNLH